MCPTHAIYSTFLQRYLIPEEYLTAQAIFRCDSERPEVFDNMIQSGLAQELAGNSFTGTVAQAAFLTSLVTCKAWVDLKPPLNEPKTPFRVKKQEDEGMSSASKSEGDATSAAEPASHSQPSGSDSLGPQAPPMEDRRRPQKRKAPDDSEANDQLVPLRSTGDAVVPVRRARGKQKVEMLAVPSKKLKRPRGVGAGNKKAKGKKKMVSIYEKEMIFQSFERAKDAGFKVPIKEVERESLPGYFKGCLMESKWGAVRRQQQWNLLVKTCPLLCKKAKELPNSLRRLLHLKLKVSIPHQLSSSKYQHVPFPLQQAVEEMIMDRLVLGEEVTLTLIKNTMSFAIGIFNEVVETMRHNFSTMTLETLKSQDDRLATCSQHKLSQISMTCRSVPKASLMHCCCEFPGMF